MVGSDTSIFNAMKPEDMRRVLDGESTEYERRLLFAALDSDKGPRGASPVPDLTWLIDLAFMSPARAIEVVNGYLLVHFQVLNDQTIDGLDDFLDTIRAHFHLQTGSVDDVSSLRALDPTSLEMVAAAVWRRLGYDTIVTPRSKDGGKDVVARSLRPGSRGVVYIECKQWAKKVGVVPVRALRGVIAQEQVTSGILVAPGGFTDGTGTATELAAGSAVIELVDGMELSKLLRLTYGPKWVHDLDIIRLAGSRGLKRSA